MEGWLPDWLAGNEMWDLGASPPLAILGIQAAATATIITTSSIVVAVAPGIKFASF
jgi:hypothetical protein